MGESCKIYLETLSIFYLIIVDDDDDKVKDNNDNENETLKSTMHTHDQYHAEQYSSLTTQSSVTFNLLSRAESTIFIATTINNQHFLQISAPLCKSEKKTSINHSTHLTTQWHQLPPSLAPFLINPNPVINLISQSRSTLSGNFNNHLSITNNCNMNSSYLNLIMSPIEYFLITIKCTFKLQLTNVLTMQGEITV